MKSLPTSLLLGALTLVMSGSAFADRPDRCVINGVNLRGFNFNEQPAQYVLAEGDTQAVMRVDPIEEALTRLGPLATVHYPHGRSVVLTFRDFLWAARALNGELTVLPRRAVSRMDASEREEYTDYYLRHARIVVGTMMNRNYFVSGGRPRNMADFIRNFSQPVNPAWMRDGRFCDRTSPDYVRNRCSEENLRIRDERANIFWSELPQAAKKVVLEMFTGRKDNPLPSSVDFARRRLNRNGENVTCIYGNGTVLPVVATIARSRTSNSVHSFCGNPDGEMTVRVEPTAWARCLPELRETLEPFTGSVHH